MKRIVRRCSLCVADVFDAAGDSPQVFDKFSVRCSSSGAVAESCVKLRQGVYCNDSGKVVDVVIVPFVAVTTT
jgi:hypothetical protein